MVQTTKVVGCKDAQELRLIERLFVIEEKILLTTSVMQQAKVRRIGYGARKYIYIKLGGICQDKLTKLEREQQDILAALEG